MLQASSSFDADRGTANLVAKLDLTSVNLIHATGESTSEAINVGKEPISDRREPPVADNNASSHEAPKLKTFQLRYFLGDLPILSLRFRAHIERAPFEPTVSEAVTTPWEPKFSPGVEVAIRLGERVSEMGPALRATRRGICYLRNRQPTHFFELAGTFDDYVKGFSSKARRNLQRRTRKLEAMAEGTLECRSYAGAETVDEFHELARRIAIKSYQERLLGIAIPDTREFIERLHALARTDSFRGYILFVKGQPVAYEYFVTEKGVVEEIYIGYDQKYAEGSPGIVLLYMAVERLFAERRFRYCDLGYGEGHRKKEFGRSEFLRADVLYFRWRPKSILAVPAHLVLDRLSRLIGLLLQQFGLRHRIRRLLRSSSE